MIKRVFIAVFCVNIAIAAIAQSKIADNLNEQELNTIVGRPYELFDATAFCSYSNFHPSEYLTDNNWDILCAFVQPGTVARLDSLGIPYTKSQIRLLEVGDLLSSNRGMYTTSINIFDKSETAVIREQSKEFARSIFPEIEPEIHQLISAFTQAGYAKQTYSLVFSYLLDSYIWDYDLLSPPISCKDHGTWSGIYWAMYEGRTHDKIGTNAYGSVMQNWTDSLGYWLSSNKLISFALEVEKTKGRRIENKDVIEAIAGWGLTDEEGNILIPVLHKNSNDAIDCLCRSIATKLSVAVKEYCRTWYTVHNISSEREGQIIFYHEVMWDLLNILESKGMIVMPEILKGEAVGKQHFGDICFIVVDDSEG